MSKTLARRCFTGRLIGAMRDGCSLVERSTKELLLVMHLVPIADT